MTEKHYSVRARVSTENPGAVRPILKRLLASGSVRWEEDSKEFVIEGELDGLNARDLNRNLLSALRRVEKRTRVRSEWTCEGTIERFFDYVPKGRRTASPDPTARA